MLKVKVCGLCRPDNIREVLEAGADLVGFVFYRSSPRYAGENIYRSCLRFIPDSVPRVGVFVNEDNDRILEIAALARLDMVQLHGGETPDDCRFLRSRQIRVIKSFGVHDGFDFSRVEPYQDACDFFLFDTRSPDFGGSGIRFNWKIVDRYTGKVPFFISGGIGPPDHRHLRSLNHKQLYGADVNSRFETQPGVKDAALLRNFIHQIKQI